MITDIDCFEAMNSKFEFVEMDPTNPELMKVRRHWHKDGFNCSYPYLLPVCKVDIDVLKKYNIWDSITTEVQKKLENMTVEEKQAVHNLLAKARAGRKQKYVGVARELTCSKCGKKVAIQPSVLVKRVEKIAAVKGITYLMDDYLKSYECSICNPVKRGKKPNPEFANLPKTLTCKCGKTVAANVYQLKKKAEKNNTTIQKLIEGFVCQQCKPTIGVTVGGRRALTVEEKTDRINAKASIKDAKKLARAERKAEKEKQKALKNSMPKRKRGRPRKNLTSTE